MKPIVRWTIGDVKLRGFHILDRSIKNMLELYGDRFEYFVYCNCNADYNTDRVRKTCEKYNVNLYLQKWETCPFPAPSDAIYPSIWKVCPPRLKMDVHELILDNDVVFLKKPVEIEEFLDSDKTLVVEDTLRYFGVFNRWFRDDEAYNSGIMGCPPGYDFGKKIMGTWSERFEKMKNRKLGYGDEQGLLTYTLLQHPNIIVSSNRFAGLHADNVSDLVFNNMGEKKNPKMHNYTQENLEKIKKLPVLHFLESNRNPFHFAWSELFENKKIHF